MVNASPSNPPLSLWVIRNLLQEYDLKVSLTSHVHSSVTNMPEMIKKFPYDSPDNRTELQAKFTLIWKNGTKSKLY